jgi:predicted nucleotidyltransferase
VPDLRDCRFPDLGPPYDDALREAAAYVLERFDPVAILACGTVVGGAPDPGSDLDLYVILARPGGNAYRSASAACRPRSS